jgi:hypothetical protein
VVSALLIRRSNRPAGGIQQEGLALAVAAGD